MISIVTPFLNGLDLLADYEAATLGAELVLIDNGSDEPTREALSTLPPERGRVIRNESNIGFAAANNQGYAQATGDIIIFLNSDIAGDPSWLKLVADDVQDGALYGPSLNVQLVYGLRVPYIEGWCIAATRTTWERLTWENKHHTIIGNTPDQDRFGRLGPWDQHAYPGPYWEDNDLCLRALEMDISLTQTQWPIQHKGGRSAGPLVKHGDTFERNRATFAARVGQAWERMMAR
jgi:GT2 family glycosyltransferase